VPLSKNIPVDRIQDDAVKDAFRYLAKLLEDLENRLPTVEYVDWTPRLAFGGSSTGITYVAGLAGQAGTCIVIDRKIQILVGTLVLTSKGAQVGNATIEDVPYTWLTDNRGLSIGTLRIVTITYLSYPTLRTVANAKQLAFQQTTEAGVASSLTDTNFANTSNVIFSMIGRIAP